MPRVVFCLVDDAGAEIEPLMTVGQAKDVLKITRSRIRQLVLLKVLTPVPMDGRTYLIRKREVDAYAKTDRMPGRKATKF